MLLSQLSLKLGRRHTRNKDLHLHTTSIEIEQNITFQKCGTERQTSFGTQQSTKKQGEKENYFLELGPDLYAKHFREVQFFLIEPLQLLFLELVAYYGAGAKQQSKVVKAN